MINQRHRLGVLVLAAVTLLSVAAPARAADPDPTVAVSSDGAVWGTELSGPLFDPAERWVPGDTGIASFYLRNDAASSASVRIEARDLGTRMLTTNGDVVLRARVDDGAWLLLAMEDTSALLNRVAVPAGGVARIDIQAEFAPTTGNGSKDQVATLEFVVRLQDSRGDAPTPTPTSPAPTTTPTTPTLSEGTSSGALPWTGAPPVVLPILGASFLIGTGLALTRRREREASDG